MKLRLLILWLAAGMILFFLLNLHYRAQVGPPWENLTGLDEQRWIWYPPESTGGLRYAPDHARQIASCLTTLTVAFAAWLTVPLRRSIVQPPASRLSFAFARAILPVLRRYPASLCGGCLALIGSIALLFGSGDPDRVPNAVFCLAIAAVAFGVPLAILRGQAEARASRPAMPDLLPKPKRPGAPPAWTATNVMPDQAVPSGNGNFSRN